MRYGDVDVPYRKDRYYGCSVYQLPEDVVADVDGEGDDGYSDDGCRAGKIEAGPLH